MKYYSYIWNVRLFNYECFSTKKTNRNGILKMNKIEAKIIFWIDLIFRSIVNKKLQSANHEKFSKFCRNYLIWFTLKFKMKQYKNEETVSVDGNKSDLISVIDFCRCG